MAPTPTLVSSHTGHTGQPISPGGETLSSEKAHGLGRVCIRAATLGRHPYLSGGVSLSLEAVSGQHRVGGKQSLSFSL